MNIVRTAEDLAALEGSIFVATMGALHAGHGSLITRAREMADRRGRGVVVSVFVNPTQFDEATDFKSYPRTLDADAALCAALGADAVYAPPVEEVYPQGLAKPREEDLPALARGRGLEDEYRPGHFAGVYAVVKRMFELTRCSAALFGEKDWQQYQLVRAMAEREKMDVEVVGVPTVREPDGLAMSSRNVRLKGAMRDRALGLSRGIRAAQREKSPEAAERAARAEIERSGAIVEYAAVRDAATLGPARPGEPARILVAARVLAQGEPGGEDTRLIDNDVWPA